VNHPIKLEFENFLERDEVYDWRFVNKKIKR
jgi:hypothetical protein